MEGWPQNNERAFFTSAEEVVVQSENTSSKVNNSRSRWVELLLKDRSTIMLQVKVKLICSISIDRVKLSSGKF